MCEHARIPCILELLDLPLSANSSARKCPMPPGVHLHLLAQASLVSRRFRLFTDCVTYPVISAYFVLFPSAIVTPSCVDNANSEYVANLAAHYASVVPEASASTSHNPNPFLVSTTTDLSHPSLTNNPPSASTQRGSSDNFVFFSSFVESLQAPTS
jgi:hypothetical protein